MVRIKLDVFGDIQIDRTLLRWSDSIRDMRPAFRAVGDDFIRIEAEQFRTEGARSSTWQQLAASTLAAKQAAGYPRDILVATGALKRSLTSKRGPGVKHDIRRNEAVLGTTIPYAKYHQFGTRNMPRRRPVELNNRDRTEWVKILQRFITTGEV